MTPIEQTSDSSPRGPKSAGYTTFVESAGLYTAKRAYELSKGCTNPTGEGLLIVDKSFPKSEILEYGRLHGAVFAIPKHLLNKLYPIRTVAKLWLN